MEEQLIRLVGVSPIPEGGYKQLLSEPIVFDKFDTSKNNLIMSNFLSGFRDGDTKTNNLYESRNTVKDIKDKNNWFKELLSTRPDNVAKIFAGCYYSNGGSDEVKPYIDYIPTIPKKIFKSFPDPQTFESTLVECIRSGSTIPFFEDSINEMIRNDESIKSIAGYLNSNISREEFANLVNGGLADAEPKAFKSLLVANKDSFEVDKNIIKAFVGYRLAKRLIAGGKNRLEYPDRSVETFFAGIPYQEYLEIPVLSRLIIENASDVFFKFQEGGISYYTMNKLPEEREVQSVHILPILYKEDQTLYKRALDISAGLDRTVINSEEDIMPITLNIKREKLGGFINELNCSSNLQEVYDRYKGGDDTEFARSIDIFNLDVNLLKVGGSKYTIDVNTCANGYALTLIPQEIKKIGVEALDNYLGGKFDGPVKYFLEGGYDEVELDMRSKMIEDIIRINPNGGFPNNELIQLLAGDSREISIRDFSEMCRGRSEEWIAKHFPSELIRTSFKDAHHITTIGGDISDIADMRFDGILGSSSYVLKHDDATATEFKEASLSIVMNPIGIMKNNPGNYNINFDITKWSVGHRNALLNECFECLLNHEKLKKVAPELYDAMKKHMVNIILALIMAFFKLPAATTNNAALLSKDQLRGFIFNDACLDLATRTITNFTGLIRCDLIAPGTPNAIFLVNPNAARGDKADFANDVKEERYRTDIPVPANEKYKTLGFENSPSDVVKNNSLVEHLMYRKIEGYDSEFLTFDLPSFASIDFNTHLVDDGGAELTLRLLVDQMTRNVLYSNSDGAVPDAFTNADFLDGTGTEVPLSSYRTPFMGGYRTPEDPYESPPAMGGAITIAHRQAYLMYIIYSAYFLSIPHYCTIRPYRIIYKSDSTVLFTRNTPDMSMSDPDACRLESAKILLKAEKKNASLGAATISSYLVPKKGYIRIPYMIKDLRDFNGIKNAIGLDEHGYYFDLLGSEWSIGYALDPKYLSILSDKLNKGAREAKTNFQTFQRELTKALMGINSFFPNIIKIINNNKLDAMNLGLYSYSSYIYKILTELASYGTTYRLYNDLQQLVRNSVTVKPENIKVNDLMNSDYYYNYINGVGAAQYRRMTHLINQYISNNKYTFPISYALSKSTVITKIQDLTNVNVKVTMLEMLCYNPALYDMINALLDIVKMIMSNVGGTYIRLFLSDFLNKMNSKDANLHEIAQVIYSMNYLLTTKIDSFKDQILDDHRALGEPWNDMFGKSDKLKFYTDCTQVYVGTTPLTVAATDKIPEDQCLGFVSATSPGIVTKEMIKGNTLQATGGNVIM